MKKNHLFILCIVQLISYQLWAQNTEDEANSGSRKRALINDNWKFLSTG